MTIVRAGTLTLRLAIPPLLLLARADHINRKWHVQMHLIVNGCGGSQHRMLYGP